MPNTPLRIAVVMDPIEHIKPRKDTTLAMMLAAQRRGWELHYLELDDARFRSHVVGNGHLDGHGGRGRNLGSRRRTLLDPGRSVAHARAFSAAALPARRPKTTHSSSELPIMRFLPWVPPAISPHA